MSRSTHRRSPTLRPYPVCICGTGAYLPPRQILSNDLDIKYNRPLGMTEARSGVRTRHWVGESETSSRMATLAIREALSSAAIAATDLDAVIIASVAPEQFMPTNAVLVLRELGLGGNDANGVEGFDVNASCLGFLTAFEIATLGIAAGRWDTVAICACEIASKALNHEDVESSAIFGDGAGAAILSRAGGDNAGSEVVVVRSQTWSGGADLCQIKAGGTRWNVTTPPPDPQAYLFTMNGLGLMKVASRVMPAFLAGVLSDASLSVDKVDVVVPHQVSALGLRYLRERLGVPDGKVVDILATHGNQVSASLPTALHVAVSSGRLVRGNIALLLGTAAGLSIGAIVLRY